MSTPRCFIIPLEQPDRFIAVVADDKEVVEAFIFMATDPEDKAERAFEARGIGISGATLLVDPRRSEQGPTIRDADDQRIGLAELVEAMLLPRYESDADWSYWSKLVDLTLLVFGLDGRTEWLQEALEQLPSRVLPFESAMEVPREIGEGYQSVTDCYRRTGEIKAQKRQIWVCSPDLAPLGAVVLV